MKNILSTVITGLFLSTSALSVQASDSWGSVIESKIGDMVQSATLVTPTLSDEGYTLSHPGASFIKLHISQVTLAEGEYFTVSDANGFETYRYPGDQTTSDHANDSGFWALSVLGDTAVIHFYGLSGEQADATSSNSIFIDKYSYGLSGNAIVDEKSSSGFSSFDGPVLESVCGSRDWENVECAADTHPTEYAHTGPTARVIFTKNNGTFTCTGWRVGPNANTLMTNEHCLEDQAITDTAEIWFNYQYDNCGGAGDATAGRIVVTADELLVVNHGLDMALITINNPELIEQFGFYELDNRAPLQDERIYIPQHPSGDPKKLSIVDDQTGSDCKVDDAELFGRLPGSDLGYNCDTTGGSSGSAVLAASTNKVIGLHHFGGCLNSGVRIDKIYPLVDPFLDDVPDNCNNPVLTTHVLAAANFEDGSLGNFLSKTSNKVEYSFQVTSGSTPTGQTGPTKAKEGSQYAYVETSEGEGAFEPKGYARLKTKKKISGQNLQLTFRYHMFGDDIGKLRVQVLRDGEKAWNNHWTKKGDRGDSWRKATVDLSEYTGPISVRFAFISSGGQHGDIAIDDIEITETTETFPNNCPI